MFPAVAMIYKQLLNNYRICSGTTDQFAKCPQLRASSGYYYFLKLMTLLNFNYSTHKTEWNWRGEYIVLQHVFYDTHR